MGINSPSDIVADIQIAPTSEGSVRIFVTTDKLEIPMDFSPDEAREIAEEIIASANHIEKKSRKR